MANICDNKFLISCENEEVLLHISNKLRKLFENKLCQCGCLTYKFKKGDANDIN